MNKLTCSIVFVLAGMMLSPQAKCIKEKDSSLQTVSKYVIPFSLSENRILFPVMMSDHIFQFEFDTGAARATALSKKAAQSAGVSIDKVLWGIGVGGKPVRFGRAHVGKIKVARRVVLHDIELVVVPLPTTADGMEIDGLMGVDLLKRFVVRVDYTNEKMTLIRPSQFHAAQEGCELPLHFINGRPAIKGALDGMKGMFIIDMGSSGTVTVFSPFSSEHGLYEHYDAGPVRRWGVGISGAAMGRVAHIGTLDLGKIPITHVAAILSTAKRGSHASTEAMGSIGGKLLRRFTVTFDYARKRVYLKPNQEYAGSGIQSYCQGTTAH